MIFNVCNCHCPCRAEVDHCAGICVACRLGLHVEGEGRLAYWIAPGLPERPQVDAEPSR